MHHTEDPNLVGEGVMTRANSPPRLGLIGVPTAAETMMLERDIRLVALTAGAITPPSLTCRESLDVLTRAKDAGLSLSASASINHLTLNENDNRPLPHLPENSPPLRTEATAQALVAALASA